MHAGTVCGVPMVGDLNVGTPTLGGAVSTGSLGDCVSICMGTSSCNAAIYNGATGLCYLKSVDADSAVVTPRGAFLSQIICPMPPSMGGYGM